MNEKLAINLFYVFAAAIWGATACLWYMLWFFNPYTGYGEITAPSTAMFLMAILALFSCHSHNAKHLIILATISFLPIGLYLLATPGIFALIGVLNLTSLALGALIAAIGEPVAAYDCQQENK